MKIAYLNLVHSNPQLLKRAIQILSTENSGFFVHIDQKADAKKFVDVVGNNIHFIEPRVSVNWGEFSQVDATIRLIRSALASDSHYEYFVFLQGSDYPLRTGGYVEALLEAHHGWEFVNLVKMPAPGYPLSKIERLRYPAERPVLRFMSRALAKVSLANRDFRKHLRQLEPYAGQAMWTLSRQALTHIIEFTDLNPWMEEYFRNTFTPDEMFFHTILGNSPFRSRSRRNLVYVDWPSPGRHPAMLDEQHVKCFELQDKVWVDDEWGSGEVVFARKLSDDRLHLLDEIDEMITRKESRQAAGRREPFSSVTEPSQ